MKLYRANITSRERFGDHALVSYAWEDEPPEPGQFVMVRSRDPARAVDPFLSRPLFAHDYHEGVMSLLFEVRGRGTELLACENESLLVSAPLGRGFDVGSGPAAIVGGEIWVSPLKLLSRRMAESGIEHDVYLELPVSATDAYKSWLPTCYPDATLVSTDGSASSSRFVLDSLGEPDRYASIYVSGGPEMLVAAKEAFPDVVPAQLAVRERMACASGACYGCAVPIWDLGERVYARSCVEGPVFEAGDLAW